MWEREGRTSEMVGDTMRRERWWKDGRTSEMEGDTMRRE